MIKYYQFFPNGNENKTTFIILIKTIEKLILNSKSKDC